VKPLLRLALMAISAPDSAQKRPRFSAYPPNKRPRFSVDNFYYPQPLNQSIFEVSSLNIISVRVLERASCWVAVRDLWVKC
jgi:hypothetical protein